MATNDFPSTDPLTDFLLPCAQGVTCTFYERYCGRATLLLLGPLGDKLTTFLPLCERWQMLAIAPGPHRQWLDHPIPTLGDDGSLLRRLGFDENQPERVQALILDGTMRLQRTLFHPTLEELHHALNQLPPSAPRRLVQQVAPVLLVPRLLSGELCRALIAEHARDHRASTMVRQDKGETVLRPDERFKKRADHMLLNAALNQQVTARLTAQLVPAITRAFHYPVSRVEGFKIVCYDATHGGYFKPHRDNITQPTRHRRFALTVNLNDTYQGGTLIFPEFSADEYCPPAGGAMVFSGSHLHEVRPVTQGKRYALISFLWGEETRSTR